MKIKYILSIAIALTSLTGLAQQKEYSGKISVTPLQLEQKGDSLYVRIVYDVKGMNVDSRRSISFFPVLVTPQKRQALQEVMVKGRNNYKSYQRRVGLMTSRERARYAEVAPFAVVKGYKTKESRVVEYTKVLPYESWMDDARLDIQEDLCGCGNAPRTLEVSSLVNSIQREILVEPYIVVPHLAYLRPEVETVKHRELSGEAFLDFVVNKVDIRPDYMNNPSELKKIVNMINEVKADPNIIVKGIEIMGYASPEGSFEANKKLSENRALSLKNYLAPRFSYPRNYYKVYYGGENWLGMRESVEKSNYPFKDAVLDIIDNVPAEVDRAKNTSRKKVLMELENGDPYRRMSRELFPSLRKAICKIDYVVKGFNVEDAKQLIGKRPQDLSLNEMFLIANTYDNGSQDFIDVFETAVRLFPEDQTANLNAASAALARKDVVSAERYLGRVKLKSRILEYDNAQGVLAMLKGDYEKAESYLNSAAEAGLEAAKLNLEELAKKRENIKLREKSRR